MSASFGLCAQQKEADKVVEELGRLDGRGIRRGED